MARSRGQIRKRGPQKYLVRVYLGEIDGKRKYKSKVVNGTRKDAEKKLTEMLRKKDRGVIAQPSSEKLDSFLDEWLAMKKSQIAASTYRNYDKAIRLYIKPGLGHLRLDEVNSRLVQAFINDLDQDKDLSVAYIRTIHTTLRQALQQAVVWELIPFNPADGGRVNLPKERPRDYRIFTKKEAREFLKATEDDYPYHALWVILFTTGLRPQEALALKWEDLDEDGWLRVRRVVRLTGYETRKYEITSDMKTKRSRRRIKLPGFVQDLLERHRREQAKEMLKTGDRYERNGFIFATSIGTFLDPATVRVHFKQGLEDAGLPDEIRLYDIRHTHISHLIMDGVDLKKASSRAGHSSIKITADTYAHLSEEAEEEIAEVTAQMFGGIRAASQGSN